MIKLIGIIAACFSTLFLSGCEWALMNPAGYVAFEQRTLILICIGVMLCVVIPVMVAVVLFAIKYRAGNKESEYLPDWGHSSKVETFMWGIPITIVVVLAILTGYYTFKLEPSKPLSEDIVGTEKAVQIDAVALDWKWLFIYPEYNVASINEIYAPVNRQIFLQLSSWDNVNAFWVPKLGTVLYAMPQMNSKLHLVADRLGTFEGLSANYSGQGFADMRFKWHSVSDTEFHDWIDQIKSSGSSLDREGFLSLAKAPTTVEAREKDSAVRYFSPVEDELYYRIVNRCVDSNRECNERLMWRDAAQSLWGQLCSVFNADYQYTR